MSLYILLVVLCLILLYTGPISLYLSVSIVPAADSNLLPTHRTILAAVLDELNNAVLVEEVATWEFASCYHLVLADSAVFELVHFSLVELLTLCVHLLFLVAVVAANRFLLLEAILDDELDQWEIALEPVHELTELNVLGDVLANLHQ